MAKVSGNNSIPYWGAFVSAAQLPNVAGSPTQDQAVEAGDTAYTSSTSTYWVCVTATLGGALWTPLNAATDIYGNGDDGFANLNGVTIVPYAALVGTVYTLNRDVFLADGMIVAVGITLNTAGFRVFCNGTFTNNGTISNDGNAAALGVAGAASPVGTLGIGTAGGAGSAGVGAGVAGTNQPNTTQDASATGGAGGAGGAQAGGAGGTYVTNAAFGGVNYLVPMLTGNLFGQQTGGTISLLTIIGGGAGGGGGGSDNAGVTGGGGGGGGGVLQLIVFHLDNPGAIHVTGGAGAAASGAGGNGGGGGGGAGGIILSVSRIRTGAGTMTIAGGAGGAALGAGGVAGAPGANGRVHTQTA
jgi:hypothetical protein